MTKAKTVHPIPADEDRFVTTYGYIRQLARRGDCIREGYSMTSDNERAEAEMFRDWALRLELLVLSAHPATGNECPSCGRRCPCPARKAALRIRREAIAEAQLLSDQHLIREAEHAANRISHMKQTRLP